MAHYRYRLRCAAQDIPTSWNHRGWSCSDYQVNTARNCWTASFNKIYREDGKIYVEDLLAGYRCSAQPPTEAALFDPPSRDLLPTRLRSSMVVRRRPGKSAEVLLRGQQAKYQE